MGTGEGVVPEATRHHAGSHYVHWPLCPVILQGRDLDNVAGYGRNVRVGTWAGRGRPAFPLWSERWGRGDADDGCGDLGGLAVRSQSLVCFQIKAGATGIKNSNNNKK